MTRFLMALGLLFGGMALAAAPITFADDKKEDDKDWIQLFNGKDLMTAALCEPP